MTGRLLSDAELAALLNKSERDVDALVAHIAAQAACEAQLESTVSEYADQIVEQERRLHAQAERIAELEGALREAIDWAKRPSPIPIIPFQDFCARAEKLMRPCICPSHASNRGECPVHDDHGRLRATGEPEGDDSQPHHVNRYHGHEQGA